MPSSSPTPSSRCGRARFRRRWRCAGTRRQRDRLSRGLFTATNRIATYDWDQPTVQGLLREVSASMSDETELLQALPAQRECALGAGLARLTRCVARR